MKKILLVSMFIFSLSSYQAIAQDRVISGKVTSLTDGVGLPGVNVIIKGSTRGTVTDVEGKYKLSVAQEGDLTLIFSFVGLETEEVAVGARSVVDVQMSSDITQLNEVVVTANAIEREKRSLGYSVTTVDNEEITKSREANLINSLAGKVAGLQITSSSGALGASSKILIRGANSLTGNNQPLFVVDGIPMNNQTFNDVGGTSGNGDFIEVDYGTPISDLNADDIKTVTVLPGAAAAALYGSRARDGAIIITTKKGTRSKTGRTSVTVNSSYRFDTPLRLPDFQNEYGPGQDGKFFENTGLAWGPKLSEIQGQLLPNWNGDSVTLRAYPDNVKDFYDIGKTIINSVALSGGNEKSNFRLGYTNVNQKGIIPNTTLVRNTFSVNAGTTLDNGIDVSVGLNYVNSDNDGRPGNLNDINGIQRTFDINDIRDNYINPDGTENGLSLTTNNPFYLLNENPRTVDRDRVFGFFRVGYNITDWLNLSGRLGADYYNESRFNITSKNTIGRLDGAFRSDELQDKQLNSDIMLTVNKALTDDFRVKAILGHNINITQNERSWNVGNNITVEGLYRPGNAEVNNPGFDANERRIVGAYLDLGFEFRNWAFLNGTIRNDRSSTLPDDNNSYWYPSVSSSVILTEALDISSNIFSYMKLRGNIAGVGSDTSPYQLDFLYSPTTSIFGYFTGADNTYPINGGITAFGGPSTIPPLDLKPQRQTSWEVGTEVQLFDGKLAIDATYYNTVTKDQIIDLPIARSSGYSAKRINVAEVSNEGINILLTTTPVKTSSGFQWDMSFNYSKNTQKLEKLSDEGGEDEEFLLTSGLGDLQVKAGVGEAFSLYGSKFEVDSVTGKYVINPVTGLRIESQNEKLGEIFPDFTLGFQNSFSYKGINLSFLLHWQKGGVLYSSTINSLRDAGLLAETAVNREGTFIDDGVIINEDGTRTPNTTPVESMFSWYRNIYTNVSEAATFDASYVKLRELRLGYALPQSLLEKTPFGNVQFAIEGRNLMLLHSKIPHIDPETSTFSADGNGGGVERRGLPSTRSIGFNLSLTF